MTSSIPRPEFPRPDFIRTKWENLNGEWDFSFNSDTFDKKIIVPFCYQSTLSGIHDEKDYDVVWYKRSFFAHKNDLKNQSLLLKFGAVDYETHLWINDIYIGTHVGGHSSFEFDIGHAIIDGENTIKVKALDYKNADKPRGKQTWTGEKFACWYTPTTGIWQTVWLEYVGKKYLKKVKITPNTKDLLALCEFFVSSYDKIEVKLSAKMDYQGKTHLFGEQQVLCEQGYGKALLSFHDFDWHRHLVLWSPENPVLIDVTIEIIQDGEHDKVETYFGMRSIGVKDGIFMLNEQPYYQRLILDQGYWTESLLTPPSDEAIIKDIQLTKDMGFNGSRKHQKIEDPRFYYWADKLGLIVWGELPSSYQFNDTAIKNSTQEMIEFVERDFNHPCIVTWVPLNESWGARNIQVNKQQQDYSRMLTFLLKSMDPLRLVSSNDGWEQISETDICAIHDYALFPNTIEKYDNMETLLKGKAQDRFIYAENNPHKGQPIMMTEYGGIAFKKEGEEGWGYYGKVANEKEFLERLAPITYFLIKDKRFNGFCYTQLTDVMQEVNGLLTEDRKPKISIEKLKEIFAKPDYEL